MLLFPGSLWYGELRIIFATNLRAVRIQSFLICVWIGMPRSCVHWLTWMTSCSMPASDRSVGVLSVLDRTHPPPRGCETLYSDTPSPPGNEAFWPLLKV